MLHAMTPHQLDDHHHGIFNGPRLSSWASALTVSCHTSLFIHSQSKEKERKGPIPAFSEESKSDNCQAHRLCVAIVFNCSRKEIR